ncbi:MAG: EAL domain-containing protein [Lachnospiraceae bacterium]|nr:EAL domain-containing protein [Lachnospiraceae bacterium]
MNKTIGLCIETIHTPSNVSFLKAIQDIVTANGDTLFVIQTSVSWNEIVGHDLMTKGMHIDGVIVEASSYIQTERPVIIGEALAKKGAKVVLVEPAIEQRQNGFPYVRFSDENAFRQLMQYLLVDKKCKSIDLLAGEVLRGIPDVFLDIYQEELSNAGIPYDELRIAKSVAWNGNLKRHIDRLLDYDCPDAVIAMDDRAANYFNNIQAERETSGKNAIVCSVDRKYIDDNTVTVNAGIKRSAMNTAKEAMDVLYQMMEGTEVENDTVLDNIFIKAVDENLDLAREQRVRRHFGELEEEITHWSNAEVRQHATMSKILSSDSIDDIEDMIGRILPKNSCFVVPAGFLESYAGSSSSFDEKFYVFADRRRDSYQGKQFAIADLPKDQNTFIVFPVKTSRDQTGFILYQGQDYNRELYVMERMAVNLSDTFWRYFEDRELQFANRELLHANERMRQMQVRDMVTGMFNQRGFVKELEAMKDRAVEEKANIALIAIDLEGLSKINNIYGHSEGDAAIMALADIIENSLMAREVSAHIGADEFAIATIGGAEAEHVCATLIKSIQLGIENYNRISGKEYTIEINYAEKRIEPTDKTSMKKFLDDTISEKRIRKNNQRTLMDDTADRDGVNEDEKKAVMDLIDRNAFRYAFQPIINAKNGEIFAYEALMRSSEEKPLSPFLILKYATMEKRLYDIEHATFFNVLAHIKQEYRQLKNRRVFVNSIPQYMLDDSDYEKLKKTYGDYFGSLTVEVTEQTELDDRGLEILTSRSLEDGFEIAIDDYGSGYANTTTLLRYLPNCVKIDRLLISDIHEDPKKQHFVRNIIEFAHDNGFMALAEGVETLAELKAVIQMDVDLIQGYYTAKPSFEFLTEIPKEIKMDVVNANIRNHEHKNQKTYMVGNETEIPLMRLALEGYTSIVLSGQDVTIYGNQDYTASMIIKVKDGTSSRLTIRNVKLESESGLPCVDIGKNASLELNIEGRNEINEIGIRVPESASLHMVGDGTLAIRAKERMAYGIGNDMENSVGTIVLGMTGELYVAVDGFSAIGFGGGVFRGGEGIRVEAGSVHVISTGTECIGVGCNIGDMPITIDNAGVKVDLRAERGHGIGNVHGKQLTTITSSLVEVEGSGDILCGIGSMEDASGEFVFTDCRVIAALNARIAYITGTRSGDVTYEMKNTSMEFTGEGSEIVGIGTKTEEAKISTEYSSIHMTVRAAEFVLIGAKKENCRYKGGTRRLHINSDVYEVPATEKEDE